MSQTDRERRIDTAVRVAAATLAFTEAWNGPLQHGVVLQPPVRKLLAGIGVDYPPDIFRNVVRDIWRSGRLKLA